MSVDYNTLISENNQLRLAMESLEQENQDLRKRSYQSAHSEIQISTLRSENQILLSEKNDLIKQLRSQSTSNSSYGGEMRGNIEQLLRENDRLNQIIQDFKQKEMRWDQLKSSKVEELYIGEENISSLQAKLAVLSTENDRLNIVINEKEHEVEMLKNKLLPLDSMQVTVLELENKIVVLSTENEKLKAMLSDKSREIETLRMRQNTYSGDRVSPQKETLELKEKLAILSNELDRMNLADMEKDREIDELRDQVRRLNLNSSWEAKNQRLDTEEQNQLQKIKKEKEEYRYRVEELEIRNEAIEAKLQRIVKENEGYKAEIESWRNKYDAIEADLADFPQSEYQHKLTKNHSSEFKTIITEKNAEIDALKEECEILKEKEHLSVKEFERKIGMLVAENERVNNLLKQKKNEIDSIQTKTKKFDDVETKIAMLVMENQKVMTSLNEQKKETENWRNKWRALQSGMNAPNTRLEERLASLEEENEKLRIKNKDSVVQIETLKDKINQETRGKPSRNAEEARARETELKLNFLTEENESLVKSLMQKEQEVGQLRREIMELKTIETKVAHLQEQITLLVQENDRITIELEERKRDVEKWRAKAREVEQKNARISELENRLEDVIEEKNRVSEIARNNEEEYHNLEVNYSQLEKELDRLSKKEKKLESVLEGKEDLDEQLSEKIQEVEILKKKLEKANEKVIKAKEMEVAFDVQKNEYETVLKVLDEREEELRAWKSRLEITEKQIGKYEDLKEKEEQLHGDIRVLKENLADKIQELEHQEERKIELHHLKGENEVLLADKAHGDALNENLKQTVEDLAMKNNELQGKFTAVKDSYTKGVSVFEEKLDRLSKNNEALRDEALRKDEEATNYKEKYETLQKVEVYVKEFEERLRTLAQENERAENELKKREAEIETLKERLNQSNRDKAEVEMRLSMYNGSGDRSTSYGMETQKEIFRKENERLEKVHQESLRENERLRTRCYQLEKLERRNEELEDKIRDLNFAQGRLNTVITEREYEIETWMDKCNAMEKRGAGRLLELERSVEQLEDEISKLKRVIRDYERDTDKLKTRILELESIQAEQREREAQLSAKKRAENNEPRYTELRAENDDLIIENAKLKSELSNKTFELGNFNEKYELMQQGLTAKIKSLEEEADQLQQEYNLAQTEVEEWKQRYTAFKETSDRNIAKLRRRADELERDRLSDRSRGMHSNSSRHILLAAEGSNPQSLEVFQLQERLIQSLSENEKLNIENIQLRRESSIRDEIQAGASGDAESRRLYNLVNQKTRENEQLKAQLSALELTSGQRESSRVYETNNAVRMINNDLSAFGGRLSARKTEGSRDNDDQIEGMIMFVMMSAEIERLHLILVEVNETQQDQIEKISVEWERLVEAYKQRLAETEAENETLRAKLVGRSLSGFDNDIYK